MRQAWGYNQDANNCCITGVLEVASKWSEGGGGGGGGGGEGTALTSLNFAIYLYFFIYSTLDIFRYEVE